MSDIDITGDSTMQDIIEAYPAAQRALMRNYHIGGCGQCGFSPEERLADVLARKDVADVAAVITTIKESQAQEERIQVSPRELSEECHSEAPPKLIDVRDQQERDIAHIEGSQLATQELAQEMMASWPKDTPIVTCCHHGIRSLDAAAYFIGHGFTNVRSLRGGIDAWAQEIEPSLPRY